MKINKKAYSNEEKLTPNYKVIIILSLISVGLIIYGYNASKSIGKTNYSYQPDSTEVVVGENKDAFPQNNSSGPTQDSGGDLGPAKVDELIGGTNANEFYQMPSTEKLLEGKEIEINK